MRASLHSALLFSLAASCSQSPGTDGPATSEGAPQPSGGRKVTAAYLYVGGGFYSAPSAIYGYRFDRASGDLDPVGPPLSTPMSPTYLATDGARLYATIESNPGWVLAADIDPATGSLSAINQVESGGDASTHIALDATGGFIFESHYTSGSVTVLRKEPEGRVGEVVDAESFGADAQAHQVVVLPSNRHLLVVLKGQDRIAQLRFDPKTGLLAPNTPAFVSAPAGVGPRHLALHPSGSWVYAINEHGSSVSRYDLDPSTGTLQHREDVSTLAPGASTPNTGAEIQIAPSGRFLYASNRGDDSIAIFAIDALSGHLMATGRQSTLGQTPRMFALDASGSFLFVANQDSNSVATFGVDPASGLLSPFGSLLSVERPSWVGLIEL